MSSCFPYYVEENNKGVSTETRNCSFLKSNYIIQLTVTKIYHRKHYIYNAIFNN